MPEGNDAERKTETTRRCRRELGRTLPVGTNDPERLDILAKVCFYTVPTTFTFRALVLKEEGWPYLPAKSKKTKLTVMP